MSSRLCEHPQEPKESKANKRKQCVYHTPCCILVKVIKNTRRRLAQCMENVGRRLPALIFKTKYTNFLICTIALKKGSYVASLSISVLFRYRTIVQIHRFIL